MSRIHAWRWIVEPAIANLFWRPADGAAICPSCGAVHESCQGGSVGVRAGTAVARQLVIEYGLDALLALPIDAHEAYYTVCGACEAAMTPERRAALHERIARMITGALAANA